MYKKLSIIALLFAAVALALPTLADSNNGKNKGKGNSQQEHQGGGQSGHTDDESMAGALITAGITVALARELAVTHQIYRPAIAAPRHSQEPCPWQTAASRYRQTQPVRPHAGGFAALRWL